MAELIRYLDKFTARKVQDDHIRLLAALPDSLEAWITQYIQLAVTGVRSSAVTQKIALHLAHRAEANGVDSASARPAQARSRHCLSLALHRSAARRGDSPGSGSDRTANARSAPQRPQGQNYPCERERKNGTDGLFICRCKSRPG